ncbi:hypothetical protein KIH86_07580 [Paenibacillus sp. HN-1]|uniref:hypothetical protein n=1 Tax=Paenibacillus TaxID=44249 RepID=UPI001CA99C7C|nr:MULTISPECIES: hypothetical protein [Paenibacillus]MBY9080998.1 hypothetical protein [Paenibacillus sp. CGMCC 1.18879]MBY9084100.1 hypothetical protein [Paenibacillus sinensis]
MRDAVRNRILEVVPALTDVYEPHAADKDSVKPYAVVLQGDDSDESDWAGYRRILEVWPYVSRTTFADLDEIEKEIAAALTSQPLVTAAGEVFTCSFLGSSQDTVDEEWDAITRGMQFAVLALQPINSTVPITSDPWLTALTAWTDSQLDQEWAVYSGVWPLGYSKPSVMWRVKEISTRLLSLGAYQVTKQFTGHVLGVDGNDQHAGVLALMTAIGAIPKIPLDPADHRYMTVQETQANVEADALTAGQISLTLTRRTNRPLAEGPLMMEVGYRRISK